MSADADDTSVSSSTSDAECPSDLRPLAASPPRQDPFDNLPSETIVEIFSYTYPIVEVPQSMDVPREYAPRPLDPEILSTVCKRWRAIMLSNPSLWATLTIKARRIERNAWTRWGFSQLRTCLDRSGAYPLDIRLESSATNTAGAFTFIEIILQDNVIMRGVLDIIMLHSERWNSIAFVFPLGPEFVQKLNTLDDHRLPLLEKLDLTLSDKRHFEDQLTNTAFRTAPKLKSLSITGLSTQSLESLRKTYITWTQISELTFGSSDFRFAEDLREILGWASGSLTSLIFLESLDTRVADGAEEYSNKIMLTQLRRMRILGGYASVLNTLICPSLKDLELNFGNEQGITKFLDRSSCALTSFKLHFSASVDPTTYQAILQNSALSTLKCLFLSDITNPILDLLNFDTHHLFPSLETLSFYLAFGRHIEPAQTVHRIESLSGYLLDYSKFDEHTRGPQYLASQIKILQKVVDSRTCAMALNQPRSFVGGFQSDKAQWNAKSSLKNCLFHFDLQSIGPEVDDYWDKDPIHALQSFCIGRKIFVLVEISWDEIPSLVDGDYD